MVGPVEAMCTHGMTQVEPATLVALRAAWEQDHLSIVPAASVNLGTVPSPTLRKCILAGFCVCDNITLRTIVASWQSAMRRVFLKDTLWRSKLEDGFIVLKFVGSGGQIFHYHVSCCDCGSYEASLLQLTEHEDAFAQLVANSLGKFSLAVAVKSLTAAWINVWKAFRDWDFQQRWHFQVLELDTSHRLVDTFVPGENILVCDIVALSEVPFWPPPKVKDIRGVKVTPLVG